MHTIIEHDGALSLTLSLSLWLVFLNSHDKHEKNATRMHDSVRGIVAMLKRPAVQNEHKSNHDQKEGKTNASLFPVIRLVCSFAH